MYDSTQDTREHIATARIFINKLYRSLRWRSLKHDASKLEEPEKSIFDEYTPKLATSTYGSDEYKGYLKGMGVSLEHH